MEKSKKLDFIKKVFGFKQCSCLDKKIPKVKTQKDLEEKKSCCSNKKD